MPSPDRLVVVAGTGTEVGKTWWTCAVARGLRGSGVRVAARKPAQSFAPDDPVAGRDAALLAAATGESPDDVCPPHRSYPRPMAPPMASAALGRSSFTLGDLVGELRWPSTPVDVGFVETAGGVRSPLADDGDNVALIERLDPSLVLLVADGGLGTLNLVRLSVEAVGARPIVVALNRFDPDDELHARNRSWLVERDGLHVVVSIREACEALTPAG